MATGAVRTGRGVEEGEVLVSNEELQSPTLLLQREREKEVKI